MSKEKDEIRISKFLSLVLRHKPDKIGIVLDENGWTNVQILVEKSYASGIKLDLELLKHIVDTNPKKRFAFSDDHQMIRANQGHSIDIDLGYNSAEPPEILYHGTRQKSVESILKNGLEKRKRHHVHLSADIETAIKVGQRHGTPTVFEVLAGQMYHDKYEFYLSYNGVWLTEKVPTKYLREYSKNSNNSN